MILFSCEHKEFCFHHPHMVTLRMDFDWKNASQADSERMCVYFCPEEGESPIRFDFTGKDGGSVEIREERYRVLCYNNDTESPLFRRMGGFGTHEGYTRDGNVFEGIYKNGAHYASPTKGSEDEHVVICPGMMWESCTRGAEITELGLSHGCISLADKDKIEWTESSEHVTTLCPVELICIYTREARNVKNMEYMTQVCGSLPSMAPSMLFVNGGLDKECVTVPFRTEFHLGSSRITGKFYMFGHHGEGTRPCKMMFYVRYSNKEKFYTTFDMTSQVHKAPDRKHVHIIIDSAGFPELLSNENGFDIEVDGWVEVENDIIMQSLYF